MKKLLLSLSFLLSSLPSLQAEQYIYIQWTLSTDSSVEGYKLYSGLESRNYTAVTDLGKVTRVEFDIPGAPGTTYYALTAYNFQGIESEYSREVRVDVYPIPDCPLREECETCSNPTPIPCNDEPCDECPTCEQCPQATPCPACPTCKDCGPIEASLTNCNRLLESSVVQVMKLQTEAANYRAQIDDLSKENSKVNLELENIKSQLAELKVVNETLTQEVHHYRSNWEACGYTVQNWTGLTKAWEEIAIYWHSHWNACLRTLKEKR